MPRKAPAKGRERAKHAAWREAVRFVAVSQDGAGAFLNAIPMRDDMRMETWAMRLSVQRRLGLPLDVACQAAAAGKKTRNGKTHDELGDAAVNVPQQGHTQHQTQVHASTPHPRPTRRVGHGCANAEWSRRTTSVIVTTNNPTWTRS